MTRLCATAPLSNWEIALSIKLSRFFIPIHEVFRRFAALLLFNPLDRAGGFYQQYGEEI